MSKVCSGAFRSDVRCCTTCTGSFFGSALACPPIKMGAATPTGIRNLKDFTQFLLGRSCPMANQILRMFVRQEHTNFRLLTCSPFLGPGNSMLKVDRCL